MTRPLAVLRPEPGASATADRIAALGLHAIRLPLFAVRPIDWAAPPAERHDALLLTSANAVRHAGPELARLARLPVLAVGAATAEAARMAGLDVALTGRRDAAALIAEAQAHGFTRALLLGGRERMVAAGGIVADVRTVYASEALPVAPGALARIAGGIALLHSARAARRLAALAGSARGGIAIAGLSRAVVEAAGDGWAARATAAEPDDAALIAAARTLAD